MPCLSCLINLAVAGPLIAVFALIRAWNTGQRFKGSLKELSDAGKGLIKLWEMVKGTR